MATRYSTGQTEALAKNGSHKLLHSGGKIQLYSGTQPVDGDQPVSGTLLVTLTGDNAGNPGTHVFETQPEWKAPISGTNNGTGSIQLLLGGCAIHPACTPSTTAALTAAVVVTSINSEPFGPFSGFTARVSGDDVYIKGPVGSDAYLNNLVLTSSVTTVTCTIAGTGKPASSGGTDGVAHAYGCDFIHDSTTDGILTGGTWRGNAVAAGTATWGRFVLDSTDSGGLSTTLRRTDFSVSAVGGSGDMQLSTATMVASPATPVVVTGFTLTVPKL